MTGNTIFDNYYGIFTAGPVTVQGARHNHFIHVNRRFGSYPDLSLTFADRLKGNGNGQPRTGTGRLGLPG